MYRNMTDKQLKMELDRVETRQFMLDMKDKWNEDDYIDNRAYTSQIVEIKKELERRK